MWYVIHTMTGKEQECLQLCRKYVEQTSYHEMFVPCYTAQKHFKKEWHEVKKTLFPGYLFVDTDNIEKVLKGLKKFRQYTKVLQNAEEVSPITEQEQAFLSDMMDGEHIVRYSEGFLIGEKVCVTTGPLRHYEGYIKTVDRHRRVAKMDVPLFGRATPIEIGFGAIARVSREEFDRMTEQNIREHQDDPRSAGMVRVLEGVFKGMTGKFLYADAERDEWTAELELFDTAVKVAFKRDEIKMFE